MEIAPQTKETILKAALQVFTSLGFAGASMREIAELSRVTKPTIYYYFANKEELYRYLVQTILNAFNDKVAEIAAEPGSPDRKLLEVARLHMNSCREFPDYIKLFIMAVYRLDSYAPTTDIAQYGKRGIDSIAEIVREGIVSGVFREVDPIKAALHFLGALHIQELILMKRQHDDYRVVPAATPEELMSLFLEGISRR